MESIIDRDLVRKLLRKRQKTGKDMGRLLMLFLMGDIEQTGWEEKDPPMTPDDFYSAEADFYTHINSDEIEAWKRDKEKTAYNALSRLHDSALTTNNDAVDRYWQFYAGFSRLYGKLERIAESEKAQRIRDRKPAIMTAVQYEAAKEKAAEILREGRESYHSLLFNLLDGLLYNAAETTKTKPPKPLLDALEEARKEPVEGKLSLAAYNARRGYFTIGGRLERSDSMTREEWQERIAFWYQNQTGYGVDKAISLKELAERLKKERLWAAYRLFFQRQAEVPLLVCEARLVAGAKTDIFCAETDFETALFNGFIDLDFPQRERLAYNPLIIEGFSRVIGFTPPLEWHSYCDEPAGAMAEDLLRFIAKAAFCDETLLSEQVKWLLSAFKKDFPRLYGALHERIVQHIPQAADFAEGDSVFEKFVDRRDLEARGIAIREPINREIIEAATGKPSAAEEIAILQTAERGDYTEQEEETWLQSLKGKEDTLCDDATAFIYPALGYLYAYNALVKIIEQVYDLPNFAVIARKGTVELEETIQKYNSLLHIAYHDVAGSDEEKKQKREFIKRAFPELDAEAAKPSEEAVKRVATQIKKIGLTEQADRAYRYLDDFVFEMYESTKAAGKE